MEQMLKTIKSWLLPQSLLLRNKSRKDNVLYITFDDGPVPNIIEPLLSLLAKHQVKATFFIIGSRAKKNPELITEIYKQKHTVANHSFSHPKFNTISHKRKSLEINKTNSIIHEYTQEKCHLFRAPQGIWDLRLLLDLFRLNITAAHWSRDSKDFLKESPELIIKRFIDKPVQAGDIILFHDDHHRCIEALETLIPHWKSQGFQFNALENK